jgi:hypothetical protein
VTVRTRTIVVTLTVIVVLVAVGVYIGIHGFKATLPLPLRAEKCTVQGSDEVTLSLEQTQNAATIAAVGIRRNVPDQAITIALATALQESKLENLSGGDRDSVGLFQQRPSMGWGTAKQISNPRYAAGKFYSALLHVSGWQRMSLTEAAQEVQRSGAPDAYQKWAAEAGVLGRALLGDVSHAVACFVGATPLARGAAALGALASDLKSDWGTRLQQVKTADPNALALFAADNQAGWQYAHWLVAHAQDRGIMRVQFGNQQWTAKNGSWTTADTPTVAAGETVLAQVYGAAVKHTKGS